MLNAYWHLRLGQKSEIPNANILEESAQRLLASKVRTVSARLEKPRDRVCAQRLLASKVRTERDRADISRASEVVLNAYWHLRLGQICFLVNN